VRYSVDGRQSSDDVASDDVEEDATGAVVGRGVGAGAGVDAEATGAGVGEGTGIGFGVGSGVSTTIATVEAEMAVVDAVTSIAADAFEARARVAARGRGLRGQRARVVVAVDVAERRRKVAPGRRRRP
jgi:hypothetical protein